MPEYHIDWEKCGENMGKKLRTLIQDALSWVKRHPTWMTDVPAGKKSWREASWWKRR